MTILYGEEVDGFGGQEERISLTENFDKQMGHQNQVVELVRAGLI
jgi:hypothetical protein